MKIRAKISFEFYANHKWLHAKDFLCNEHRHKFFVKIIIEQIHDDREIEYLEFQRWIMEKRPELGINDSCEQYALKLFAIVALQYPYREISIEVSEDNENGAIIDGMS